MAAAAGERLREALRVASFRARMARIQAENAEKAAAEKAAEAAEADQPQEGEAAEGRRDPQVQVGHDSDGQDTADAAASEPDTCVICQKVLTPRDRQYVGATRGNVCKRCDERGRRRALKGFYANLSKNDDPTKPKVPGEQEPVPNPFFGENRGKRRDGARQERQERRADRVAANDRRRQAGGRVHPQPPIGTPFVKVSQMDKRRARAAMEAELRGAPAGSLPAHLQPRPQPKHVYGHQAVSTRKRKAAARQVVRPHRSSGSGTRGSGKAA